MTKKELPGPCSIRQHMYMFPEEYARDREGNKINTKHVDVVLFGGAAGSGKSEIGVIDFLRYTDIPNFIGVMTRRTTPQLQGPGGLFTKCKRVFSQAYQPHEYTWRAKDGKFVFHESGAEVYLKHFERDDTDINWQGAEANLFYIDEGTQFTQHMVQYIMSRMRNPSCPQVLPRLRITCNPDADHFMRKWVEPYLFEDGTPDRSKDGWLRYFSFSDGGFVWADSKEELKAEHGIEEEDALSFMFISATVMDNPIVQKINPKYVSWLRGLKGVEKARLLEGNWYVREEASSYFNRKWVEEVQHVDESEVLFTARGYDFAGELPSDLTPSPDFTASVRIRKMKDGSYIIDDIKRTRIRHSKWEEFVLECSKDDPIGTIHVIPQDPGPSAKRATQMFCKSLAEKGLITKRESTTRSKLDRFRPFAAVSGNMGVKILSGCGTCYATGAVDTNEFYLEELEKFNGERSSRAKMGRKDDLVDCTSTAFTALASRTTSLSGLSKNLVDINDSLRVGNPFNG